MADGDTFFAGGPAPVFGAPVIPARQGGLQSAVEGFGRGFLSTFERGLQDQSALELLEKKAEIKTKKGASAFVPGVTQADFRAAGFGSDPNLVPEAPVDQDQFDNLNTQGKSTVLAVAGSRQARAQIPADFNQRDSSGDIPTSVTENDLSDIEVSTEVLRTASPQSAAFGIPPEDFALLSPLAQEQALFPMGSSPNQRRVIRAALQDRISAAKLSTTQVKAASEAVKNTNMLALAGSVWKQNGYSKLSEKIGFLGGAMRLAIDVGLTEGVGFLAQNAPGMIPKLSEYMVVQGFVAEQLLRAATGAATNPSEVKKYRGMLPVPGDNPGVVDNKLRILAVKMISDSRQKQTELRATGLPRDAILATQLQNNVEQDLIKMFNLMRKDFTGQGPYGDTLDDLINVEAEDAFNSSPTTPKRQPGDAFNRDLEANPASSAGFD